MDANKSAFFADFFSLQCADGGHELVAAVLIGSEEIEGGAAGREEDGVAFVRSGKGRVNGIKQIIGGDNLQQPLSISPLRGEVTEMFL